MRTYQGRNIWDDPIIEKSQDQDQGQGQGQDQKLRQRSTLQQQMVLALTPTLVLVLTLAPSGMISKKGVPEFCPSTVVKNLKQKTHETRSPECGPDPQWKGPASHRTPELVYKPYLPLEVHQKSINNPSTKIAKIYMTMACLYPS